MIKDEPFIPEWLEAYRLPDDLIAEAYEKTPPAYRAALKTGIALAHFHFGSLPSMESRIICVRNLGFSQRKIGVPADWAAIVMPATLKGASPVCAAAILPALAGVERIIALCAGMPLKTDIALGLELCGVNDIFMAEEHQCFRALAELSRVSRAGRILFLHTGELSKIIEQAGKHRLRFIDLLYKPALLLLDESEFNLELLEFCTGMMPETMQSLRSYWDAIYCAREDAPAEIDAGLVLHKGCEGLWIYENLGPESFLDTKWAFDIHR